MDKAADAVTVPIPEGTEVRLSTPPATLDDRIARHELWLTSAGNLGEQLKMDGEDLSRDGFRLDLRRRDLRNAELRRVKFGPVNVDETCFEDADLTCSDISEGREAETAHFGGADLRGAKLPDGLTFDGDLKRVEEMSKNCGKYFLSVLGGCAYVLLTIFTTTDGGLLTRTASSTLPFLQTSISIYGFYLWAPVLLLGVYLFYQLNLQSLWEACAVLPARFPDGKNVGQATYPWVVNELCRIYAARLQTRRNVLQVNLIDWVTNASVIVLTYWSVPIVLLIVWRRCLPRHDFSLIDKIFGRFPFGLTDWHVVLVGIGTWFATVSMSLALSTLRRSQSRIEQRKHPFGSVRAFGIFGLSIAVASCLSAVLWQISRIAITHTPRGSFRNLAVATVEGEDISTRPDGWAGNDKEGLPAVHGAALQDVDMRYLKGNHAFLVNADLRGANLSHADLTFSDLRGALLEPTHEAKPRPTNLYEADLASADARWASFDHANLSHSRLVSIRLDKAYLLSADLTYANLFAADVQDSYMARAQLRSAYLQFADLQNTTLRFADIETADLSYANLLNVDMSHARLQNASLYRADLQKADLAGAQLQKASLFQADLQAADLILANLQGSWLYGANLQNADLHLADLRNADMEFADLRNADLRGANLRLAKGLTQTMIDSAITDKFTLVSPPLQIHVNVR